MSLQGAKKRAMALLAAASLLAASMAGISADEGDGEAPAEPALQPTQVVAEIPEEYGALFPLEWGGGSLLHLKGRLATMGCIADTLWVYDNNKWNPYNQYQVPHTLQIIKDFKQTYTEYIPPTTVYADCTNICEFGGRECLSFDENREQNDNYAHRSFFKISPLTDSDSCTTDFNPKVTSQVLPNLPTRPDTCIVTKQKNNGRGVSGLAIDDNINTPPFIALFDESTPYRTSTEHTDILLKKEIHELCHINQNWYWLQQLEFNSYSRYYGALLQFPDFPHGQTFIDLVGYKKNTNRDWILPTNSVYRDIYSKDPIELAAELCSMYLLERMGERSNYDYQRYNYGGYGFRRVPVRTTNVNKYLTPQIREWLETYMILPNLAN